MRSRGTKRGTGEAVKTRLSEVSSASTHSTPLHKQSEQTFAIAGSDSQSSLVVKSLPGFVALKIQQMRWISAGDKSIARFPLRKGLAIEFTQYPLYIHLWKSLSNSFHVVSTQFPQIPDASRTALFTPYKCVP